VKVTSVLTPAGRGAGEDPLDVSSALVFDRGEGGANRPVRLFEVGVPKGGKFVSAWHRLRHQRRRHRHQRPNISGAAEEVHGDAATQLLVKNFAGEHKQNPNVENGVKKMSLTTLFILVIFGCITSLIAKKRHLGYDKFGDQAPLAFFIFGALLFIVALPWVILAPAGQKQSPDSQH
jgi:hypothetical protein